MPLRISLGIPLGTVIVHYLFNAKVSVINRKIRSIAIRMILTLAGRDTETGICVCVHFKILQVSWKYRILAGIKRRTFLSFRKIVKKRTHFSMDKYLLSVECLQKNCVLRCGN